MIIPEYILSKNIAKTRRKLLKSHPADASHFFSRK